MSNIPSWVGILNVNVCVLLHSSVIAECHKEEKREEEKSNNKLVIMNTYIRVNTLAQAQIQKKKFQQTEESRVFI